VPLCCMRGQNGDLLRKIMAFALVLEGRYAVSHSVYWDNRWCAGLREQSTDNRAKALIRMLSQIEFSDKVECC